MEDEEEKIKRISKRLINISELADISYDILRVIKDNNTLSQSLTKSIDAWIAQYTILAIETSKENTNPTIH